MANEWGAAGNMLTGAGMGLQGKGAQFQRNLMYQREQEEKAAERQRKREQARMETVYTDSAAALNLAQQGRFDMVAQLGEKRLASAPSFPEADFSDTEKLTQLARAAAGGDPLAANQLTSQLQNNVAIGEAIGVLGSGENQLQDIQQGTDAEGNPILFGIDPKTRTAVQIDSNGIRPAEDEDPASNTQFAGNTMLKDEAGNLFIATRAGDPNTGATRASLAAVGHSGEPQGQLSMVNTMGLTAGETPGQRGAETTAAENAKSSAQIAKDAFDKIGTVRGSIQNIDRGIAALNKGANTGPIYKMLPDITAASVEMQNVVNNMGLDIIGATTFGALSGDELKFALDSAIPTGLQPDELKKWLQRKKRGQQKMATELSRAARYFGRGGSIADYLGGMERSGTLKYGSPQNSAQTGQGGNEDIPAAPGGQNTPPPPAGGVKFMGFD